MPRISVVIPTYNRKHIIKEAIDSVFLQNPQLFELIVVDDGSTDRTPDYIKTLNYPIRVVRGSHKGIAASRNRGIALATCEFIAFLDSDDLWLERILEKQLDFLTTNPEKALVYTDQYISINNQLTKKTRFQNVDLSSAEMTRFTLTGFVQFVPIHISSVMVRKSTFKSVGLFEERLQVHDDTELWNRISQKFELGYISEPLAIRRCSRDPNRITGDGKRQLYCDDGRKYLEILQEKLGTDITPVQFRSIEASYKVIDEIENSQIPLHFHLRNFE